MKKLYVSHFLFFPRDVQSFMLTAHAPSCSRNQTATMVATKTEKGLDFCNFITKSVFFVIVLFFLSCFGLMFHEFVEHYSEI